MLRPRPQRDVDRALRENHLAGLRSTRLERERKQQEELLDREREQQEIIEQEAFGMQMAAEMHSSGQEEIDPAHQEEIDSAHQEEIAPAHNAAMDTDIDVGIDELVKVAEASRARWGNQSAYTSVEKYFAKPIWELSADEVEIDSLAKYRQVITVCGSLAKIMGRLNAPRDAVKVVEGMRRVTAMRLKLRTYKDAHRHAPRASKVDQAVAEQNALLLTEEVVEAAHDKLVMQLMNNTAKRRALQALKNSLFDSTAQIADDAIMDPEGLGAEPDEDPPTPHESKQFGADAKTRKKPKLNEDVLRCQVILKTGKRRGFACDRKLPCAVHRKQKITAVADGADACTTIAAVSVDVWQRVWQFVFTWTRKPQFPAVRIFVHEALKRAFASFGDLAKMGEPRIISEEGITYMSAARMPPGSRYKCPPDGHCLAFALVASQCPEIWARLKLTDIGHFVSSGSREVREFFEALADAAWTRAQKKMVEAGQDEQAKLMEKAGVGLEELPYFMPDVGGMARVRIEAPGTPYSEQMPAVQYCGHGPVSLEIVFCISQDGAGARATHWELAQTWVDSRLTPAFPPRDEAWLNRVLGDTDLH